MSKYTTSLVLLLLASASAAQAQGTSAADALLSTLHGNVSDQRHNEVIHSAPPTSAIQEEIKLDNAVARQMFNDWSNQNGLSYEYNSWLKQFFSAHYETFAHLKTAMATQTDSLKSVSLRNDIKAAFLYSVYRLDLPQMFMNEWLTAMENDEFAASRAAAALDEGLAANSAFDAWLLSHKVILSSGQEAVVKRIGSSRHPIWLSLNAFVFQRRGILAEEFLPKLAINSPFRPKLSMTVALAYAKKGDLGDAAKILKLYYEPWVNQSKDAKAVSSYTLQIARLLYQVGSVDGAIQYYSKIPKGSPDYITAREELAWSWLRQGNTTELRGNLKTLTSASMKDQFIPESFLVKAVSDLKLCFYQDVEKDFSQFLTQHMPWAKKIEAALQAPDSSEPRIVDEYSRYAMDAVKARETELTALQGLAARSESAALPAVGPQKQWTQAITALTMNLEHAKKLRSEEFRREWKSDKSVLVEAIRKMQFVKVELLSQVGESTKLTEKNDLSPAKMAEGKEKITASGDQNFPFDGVVWPDELFKLRSVNQGQCIGQM
jgi:tetratricopeptide (TPR) repeat protein